MVKNKKLGFFPVFLNNGFMFRFVFGLLLIAGAGFLVFKSPKVQFYIKPKQQRLFIAWQKDIENLYRDQKFRKVFKHISKIEVHFTDPEVAEEFTDLKTPFKANDSTGYILKLSITRWIQKNEYGFVIQHEIFDQSEDKIYEFGRTYQVGFVY